MTPFSGPNQRNWLSPASDCQNIPMFPIMSESVRPTTNGRSTSMAAVHSSLPRTDGECEAVTLQAVRMIGLQNDVCCRVIGVGIHRIRPVEKRRGVCKAVRRVKRIPDEQLFH